MTTQILNAKGEPVRLTPQEISRAAMLQRKFAEEIQNSLGYEINITTLTAISKSVVEQKFYTTPPALYLPLRVGQNAWSSNIITYRDYALSPAFEDGVINTGASNARMAESDSAVDSVSNKVVNWAKQVTWSLFDLKQAALSGNWDVVTSKERSRKKNWDLGIQQIAFWGSNSDTAVKGLLTLSGITSNTSLITTYIKSMTATQIATFVGGLVDAFRVNNSRTAYPSHFIIPESDYNGLAVLTAGTVGTFPLPLLHYLLEAFKTITMNPNFKILPCAYADQAQNAAVSGLNKNRYTLLNYDEDTLRMDIPVDYSNTLQNTLNGFNYQNAGYGQYTGVIAFRPLEVMYFDWNT